MNKEIVEAVKNIKSAILKSQSQIALNGNRIQLSLYFWNRKVYFRKYTEQLLGNRSNRKYLLSASKRNARVARFFNYKFKEYADFF